MSDQRLNFWQSRETNKKKFMPSKNSNFLCISRNTEIFNRSMINSLKKIRQKSDNSKENRNNSAQNISKYYLSIKILKKITEDYIKKTMNWKKYAKKNKDRLRIYLVKANCINSKQQSRRYKRLMWWSWKSKDWIWAWVRWKRCSKL